MFHKLFIGAVISVALSTTAIAQARLGAVSEGMASTRAQPTQAASSFGKLRTVPLQEARRLRESLDVRRRPAVLRQPLQPLYLRLAAAQVPLTRDGA